jgi:aminoglycoside phosphotransferase (APT) family kinase protein
MRVSDVLRLDPSAVPGIEQPRVTAWLGDNVPELVPPLEFTRVGEGQSNLTFRVDDAGGRSVILRRPPLGEILASAHDVAREYRILAALSSAGARVPRTFALCTELDVTGAPFYAMEHVDGLVLSHVATAERLAPAARAAVGRDLATTLAGFHAFDVDELGLADLRRPESLISRQLRRWRRQWEASKTRDLPLVDELADRFAARLPEERESVLVHGDYHLGNALVGPDGDVRAVLDWELCSVGDPRADVGLLVAYWNEFGAGVGGRGGLFREAVTALPGFPTALELVEEYARASGREVTDLGFWVAFAYWKIAIIVEGVYRRWLIDPANGSDAGTLQPAVAKLAELADRAFAS